MPSGGGGNQLAAPQPTPLTIGVPTPSPTNISANSSLDGIEGPEPTGGSHVAMVGRVSILPQPGQQQIPPAARPLIGPGGPQNPQVIVKPACLVHPMTRYQSNSSSNVSLTSQTSMATTTMTNNGATTLQQQAQRQFDIQRKRFYRVGLNLFNRSPPERGINYLIHNGFIEYPEPSYNDHPTINEHGGGTADSSPGSSMSDHHYIRVEKEKELLAEAVAHFLLTRKGLSKKMIGEYVANPDPFHQLVLECMAKELNFSQMPVDQALRKFQQTFQFPGEAQQIDRIVTSFAHRYVACNQQLVQLTSSDPSLPPRPLESDQVHVLAYAILMLNSDQHNPNVGTNFNRMTNEDFIKNTQRCLKELSKDSTYALDNSYLADVFERIKEDQFKTGTDHVTQVMKVEQTLVPGKTGKVPQLAQPYRRLVCYCRLYQVYDIAKKERQGQHQREIFLFNDALLVTKIHKKTTNAQTQQPTVSYSYRGLHPLIGLSVILFEAPYYPYGIRLQRRSDDQEVITFNARNDHDRSRFVEDLIESIEEVNLTDRVVRSAALRKSKSESGLAMEAQRVTAGPPLSSHSSPNSTTGSNNNKLMTISGDQHRIHSSSGAVLLMPHNQTNGFVSKSNSLLDLSTTSSSTNSSSTNVL